MVELNAILGLRIFWSERRESLARPCIDCSFIENVVELVQDNPFPLWVLWHGSHCLVQDPIWSTTFLLFAHLLTAVCTSRASPASKSRQGAFCTVFPMPRSPCLLACLLAWHLECRVRAFHSCAFRATPWSAELTESQKWMGGSLLWTSPRTSTNTYPSL